MPYTAPTIPSGFFAQPFNASQDSYSNAYNTFYGGGLEPFVDPATGRYGYKYKNAAGTPVFVPAQQVGQQGGTPTSNTGQTGVTGSTGTFPVGGTASEGGGPDASAGGLSEAQAQGFAGGPNLDQGIMEDAQLGFGRQTSAIDAARQGMKQGRTSDLMAKGVGLGMSLAGIPGGPIVGSIGPVVEAMRTGNVTPDTAIQTFANMAFMGFPMGTAMKGVASLVDYINTQNIGRAAAGMPGYGVLDPGMLSELGLHSAVATPTVGPLGLTGINPGNVLDFDMLTGLTSAAKQASNAFSEAFGGGPDVGFGGEPGVSAEQAASAVGGFGVSGDIGFGFGGPEGGPDSGQSDAGPSSGESGAGEGAAGMGF